MDRCVSQRNKRNKAKEIAEDIWELVSDAMLFNVNCADYRPEGDVKVTFQDKCKACDFNIVRLKPSN